MLIYVSRRAKLKRLTTDDQERMRISRALPVDFDFSQTLCHPSREFRPIHGSALIDPLMLGCGVSQRPNLRHGMGHLDTAFNSTSSSFTHHFPSPVSASSSTDPSPASSITTPLKTRENQTLDKSQTTEGPTQASGLGLSQYLKSSVNLPNAFSCDQSRVLSPSGSAFQASSYCQSQASSFWRGSQTSTQEYQYGQQSQPH